MLLAAALVAFAAIAGPGRYLERDTFLHNAFPNVAPQQGTLWLTDELRAPIEQALGHSLRVLRVPYWHAAGRTAWVLDEIGKEEPITIGVVVEHGTVAMVRVLEFRESRGWEVGYPFFTDQFNGARLNGATQLDKRVDAITGATLSVSAVQRVVRTALRLHEAALRDAS